MLIRVTLITLAASLAMAAMRRVMEHARRARQSARDRGDDVRPTLKLDPNTGIYRVAEER